MDNILKQITAFADNAHGDQQRKYSPDRYIVHPIRVMETCRNYSADMAVLAAALLHDVLEDTPVTNEELKAFLLTILPASKTERVLQLVTELTDVYVKKDYPKLNRRTRKNKELLRLERTSAGSQTIKYADIMDNVAEIVNDDPDFAAVYLQECRAILRKLNKGNAELYQKAVELVDECIRSLKK